MMNAVAINEVTPIRPREVWPRINDWIDAMALGEFNWRTGFPHSIRIEEYSKGNDFYVRAEIPGVDPEKDIEISVTDGVLTIEGTREEEHESGQRSEFYYGRFMRSISLPSGAREDKIEANYQDGILRIQVPVEVAQEAHRKVPITRTD